MAINLRCIITVVALPIAVAAAGRAPAHWCP
jgi:hypothetical protein